MNKVFIKMFMVVTMILTTLSCFSSPENTKGDVKNPPSKKSLVGTWQICGPDSLVITNLYGQVGKTRYKIITPESFTVVEILIDEKILSGVFMGTYTVIDNIYTENIQYTNPTLRNFLNIKNSFKFEFKNDFLITTGMGNPYNEIWKKVKE